MSEKAVVLVSCCCSLFFSPSQSLASFDERFSGSFADPNHPGCPREITSKGLLRGYDPVPFEKGKGCRGRKVVTPEDVFQYPGKTMRYWEIQTKLVGKNKDEIYIDFDQRRERGESRRETERRGNRVPDRGGLETETRREFLSVRK